MTPFKTSTVALLAALIPGVALAHPGDHRFADLLHLIREPDHLAMIGIAVAAVVYGVVKLRARR